MGEGQKRVTAEIAGFWIRLLAYLVDVIVLWAVFAFVSGIFWMFTFPLWGWGWAIWDAGSCPFWITGFPTWLLGAAYFIIFWAMRSETLGMRILRLRIVHADGTRLKSDWETALLRFLGFLVCWITFGLLFIWVAVDGQKQGFHDKIANTYVVKIPANQRQEG